MDRVHASGGADPFFLPVGSGQRYCLYHPPARNRTPSGSLIYVHPFAEEMNRSRRLAALQARAFSAAGVGVLQIDLLGCGDSSGDFGDARWGLWKEDLEAAWAWLESHAPGPIGLWGLRLGGLLALDFAMERELTPAHVVLWQPILNGQVFLTQFLRLRLASEMLAGTQDKPTGTKELRAALAAGQTLEVAGYGLAPELANSIDGLRLGELAISGCPVHWFEVIEEIEGAELSLAPAAARVAESWTQQGVTLHSHLVPGEPFWMLPEAGECPALVSATTSLVSAEF